MSRRMGINLVILLVLVVCLGVFAWTTGAAPGVLIALITAKSLISPIRMLTYEAPLLG